MWDVATLDQLFVLADLESYNAVLIDQGKKQKERMELFRHLAVQQLQILETISLNNVSRLGVNTQGIQAITENFLHIFLQLFPQRNDVIKYRNLIYECTLDNNEKWDIQDYLSRAYFYQGNYEKGLFYRKRILDHNDHLSLYNYALALFYDQRYEEARLYNQLSTFVLRMEWQIHMRLFAQMGLLWKN